MNTITAVAHAKRRKIYLKHENMVQAIGYACKTQVYCKLLLLPGLFKISISDVSVALTEKHG